MSKPLPGILIHLQGSNFDWFWDWPGSSAIQFFCWNTWRGFEILRSENSSLLLHLPAIIVNVHCTGSKKLFFLLAGDFHVCRSSKVYILALAGERKNTAITKLLFSTRHKKRRPGFFCNYFNNKSQLINHMQNLNWRNYSLPLNSIAGLKISRAYPINEAPDLGLSSSWWPLRWWV